MKHMKKLIFLLPFLFGFIKVSKEVREMYKLEDWDALKLHLIRKAKTEKDLDKNLFDLQQLSRDYETCRQQLDLGTLPFKCFDILEREKQMGLIDSERRNAMLLFLNKKCEEGTLEILSLKDRRLKGIRKQNLSPRCRTYLAKRLETLEYKAVESDPTSLFQFRRE